MIAKYALPVAAVLQLAAAQIETATKDVTIELTGEEWATVQESANLTYSATFSGADVSAAYPGESQEGWSYRLAVKDDVVAESADGEVTASTISLSGPDGEVEFDDSWNLCLYVFPVKQSSAADGFGHEWDRDTCTGLVAPECVEDIVRIAGNKYEAGCPVFKYSPSCIRDLVEDVDPGVVSITSDNASDLIGNSTSFYRRVEGNHTAGDTEYTVLTDTLTKGHLIVSVWGASGESEQKPVALSTCLLADTVEDGSWDPLAPVEEEGAATIASAFAGWAVLSAAVLYQLL